MPIDDHRSRTPARPVIDEADDDDDENQTPEQLAELEAVLISEALQGLTEYRANPGSAVPWEDVEAELFGPPTPEELAEDAANERSLRARS